MYALIVQREEGALARGQTRSFHVTPRRENLVLGGLVVAGGALTLKYGLQVGVPFHTYLHFWPR